MDMDYIRFNEEDPLLQQVPEYRSSAFLLHPFIQMPKGWSEKKKSHPYEHVYPSDEEILTLGTPVSWETVRTICGFSSLNEVALALGTATFKRPYQRPDLEKKVSDSFSSDFYWPQEDRILVFLNKGILNDFSSNGAQNFYFSDPVFDSSGQVSIEKCTFSTISELAPAEVIITDENLQSVFISQYDRCYTIFLSKQQNLEKKITLNNWEAIICNIGTKIEWFVKG